jgi:hypothetical protein
MTNPSMGTRATASDMLDAAAKLDHIADDLERTGHEVGGAATAAAAVNIGFRFASESVATCGHLNSCIADTVRRMREQAQQLRRTAAEYTELDHQAQTDVTVR